MNNLNTSTSMGGSVTYSTGMTLCLSCGTYNCICRYNNAGPTCSICGQYTWINGNFHNCINTAPIQQTFYMCSNCGASYLINTTHTCYSTGTTLYPTTGTSTGTSWVQQVLLKQIKEITTDLELELEYIWNGTFELKLPIKFSDCFLKIGYSWSPLYPLIFSAFESDSTEMSFHLVRDITDKVFEGDKVVLKSITTIKIEDNLTLLQLCERTKEFFKDDKTNPTL